MEHGPGVHGGCGGWVVAASLALALGGCTGSSATPSTSAGPASVAAVVRQGPSTGHLLAQGTVGHWAVELDPAIVSSKYLTTDQRFVSSTCR